MSGLTLTVELDDAALGQRLADLVERLDRPIGFYKGVGEYLTKIAIPRNFSSESAPDGTPWAVLSPVTVARREAKGQTPITILRATGRMSAGISYDATNDHVLIGSPAPQAAVMQFGAAKGAFGANANGNPIPWGNIPARPFLGLSAEDEAEIIHIASDWLNLE